MSDHASHDVLQSHEVTTRNGQRIGFVQLNAEKSLNALTLPMIHLLATTLRRWAADPGIALVVLSGAGTRALCAGADIRGLRQIVLDHAGAGAPKALFDFFAEEYRLDHEIHHYPKPLLVWGSGVVMGGGIGLMVGASHRVVTETSRLAMPEIKIGLFPDVGGSHFLGRLGSGMGRFIGLTGCTMNAHDALVAGLADHFVGSADRDALFQALADADWSDQRATNEQRLNTLLDGFTAGSAPPLPDSALLRHAELIERLADVDELEQAYSNLTALSSDDAWLSGAAHTLATGSPTSAALTWELQRRARGLGLGEVFRMELVVALHCGAHADFVEGVRALMVDKDNRPQWSPPRLADLGTDDVARYFVEPVWAEGRHPLADLG